MLGEDHSLTKDFPEYQSTITKLNTDNDEFAARAKQYNAIDKEIRVLELQDAPIDDEAMHQLKHDRMALKDWLHQQLADAAN
ncbi:YdcH family protein [Pseudoalteromonas rhizosphaerae]|uniref:YdcH family protein n=1 Tax=Pseudoalteromonas rhizosphaerae TaxID=2518973 RepID=UPI00384B2C60